MSSLAAELAPVPTRLDPAELHRIVAEIEAAELALQSSPSAFYHPFIFVPVSTPTTTISDE